MSGWLNAVAVFIQRKSRFYHQTVMEISLSHRRQAVQIAGVPFAPSTGKSPTVFWMKELWLIILPTSNDFTVVNYKALVVCFWGQPMLWHHHSAVWCSVLIRYANVLAYSKEALELLQTPISAQAVLTSIGANSEKRAAANRYRP